MIRFPLFLICKNRSSFFSLLILTLCVSSSSLIAQVNPSIEISFSNISSGATYVAPESVTPQVSVTDFYDPNPTVEYEVNGQRFLTPPSISTPGNYRYGVIVGDIVGHYARKEILFSILPYPMLTGVAEPEYFDVTEDANQMVTINASVLMGSNDFDPREINVRTFGLLLYDDKGRSVNANPIRISPVSATPRPAKCEVVQAELDTPYKLASFKNTKPMALPEVCTCEKKQAEVLKHSIVEYENGYVKLPFHIQFKKLPRTGQIRTFEIVGRAFNPQTKEPSYDIVSTGVAEASPDPIAALTSIGIINADPHEVVPETPVPSCAWKSKLTKGEKDIESAKESTNSECLYNYKSYAASLIADGPSLSCSTALSVPYDCLYGWSRSNAVAGSFDFRVWLEGECKAPRIEYTLKPKVKIRSSVEAGGLHITSAKAEMAAMMQVSAEGQTATAAGGVGAGHDVSAKITLSGSPSLEVSVIATQNPMEKAFSASAAGSLNQSSLTVAGVSAVYAYSEAGVPLWGRIDANNDILSAEPGVSVTGSCNDKCGCKASGTFTVK